MEENKPRYIELRVYARADGAFAGFGTCDRGGNSVNRSFEVVGSNYADALQKLAAAMGLG